MVTEHDALPLASVVPVHDCEPTVIVTGLPERGLPPETTRCALSVAGAPAVAWRSPVYVVVVGMAATVSVAESLLVR